MWYAPGARLFFIDQNAYVISSTVVKGHAVSSERDVIKMRLAKLGWYKICDELGSFPGLTNDTPIVVMYKYHKSL